MSRRRNIKRAAIYPTEEEIKKAIENGGDEALLAMLHLKKHDNEVFFNRQKDNAALQRKLTPVNDLLKIIKERQPYLKPNQIFDHLKKLIDKAGGRWRLRNTDGQYYEFTHDADSDRKDYIECEDGK